MRFRRGREGTLSTATGRGTTPGGGIEEQLASPKFVEEGPVGQAANRPAAALDRILGHEEKAFEDPCFAERFETAEIALGHVPRGLDPDGRVVADHEVDLVAVSAAPEAEPLVPN